MRARREESVNGFPQKLSETARFRLIAAKSIALEGATEGMLHRERQLPPETELDSFHERWSKVPTLTPVIWMSLTDTIRTIQLFDDDNASQGMRKDKF